MASPPPPPRSTTIPDTVSSTDGVTIAIHDLGGDGPPLLLCHATGFCGPVWRPVAATLARRYRCIALDFRGHGRSTRPIDRPLEWQGMAEDVLAVVATISPDRPVPAVGHSMGGAALVLAETTKPGTLSKAWTFEPILFEGSPTGASAEPSEISTGARRRRATFSSRDEVIEWYSTRPPLDVLDRRALEAYVDGGFEQLPDGSLTLRCRPEDEASVFEFHNSGARRLIGEVTVPFAVAVSGAGGPPAEAATEAAEEFDNLELIVYGDVSHFGPLEDPDRLAGDMVDWFDRSG